MLRRLPGGALSFPSVLPIPHENWNTLDSAVCHEQFFLNFPLSVNVQN